MTNWQKLKSEFISGKTLSVIAKENNIPFDTVKSRHRAENWSKARNEYKRIINEKLTNKLAENKANDIFDEIENIKVLIKETEKELSNVDAGSKEGLLRSIGELYKILGTYTKKTAQKIDHSGNLQVTPIFGDLKLNVQSNNSLQDR